MQDPNTFFCSIKISKPKALQVTTTQEKEKEQILTHIAATRVVLVF